MPRRTEPRKIVAMIVAGGVSALLAVQFLTLLKPAAAREVKAACRGMQPQASNGVFDEFPVKAPNFTAEDFQGHKVSLSDFRGKVVMVHFWGSWCDVCRTEEPSLEKLQREFGSDGFVILALASDSNWNGIRKVLPHGAPYDVLLDPPAKGDTLGKVGRSYGITGVPESFIVDRNGFIRHYIVSRRDWTSSIAATCIRSLLDK